MSKFYLIAFFLLSSSVLCSGQSKEDGLKDALNKTYGKDKLIVLHELTEYYYINNNSRRALKYAKQGQYLAESVISDNNELIATDDMRLKPLSYLWLGKVQYQKKDYYDAKKSFEKALEQSIEFNEETIKSQAENYLSELDDLVSKKQDSFLSAFKEISVGEMISSSATDINLAAALKLAKTYENRENYPKAIEQYEKSINLLRDKGDSDQIKEIKAKVAELYTKSGILDEALNSYKEIKTIGNKSIDDIEEKNEIDEAINSLQKRIDKRDNTTNIELLSPKGIDQTAIAPGNLASQKLIKLATEFEEKRDFRQSLSYYKLYLEANRKIKEEEHAKELELLEYANQLENQSSQITLLQQEKELQELKLAKNQAELAKQTKFRNNLMLGTLVLLSFGLAIFSVYRKKKKALGALKTAYNELDSTQKKLAEAEQSIKKLFKQQVSEAVADELLSGVSSETISKKNVCIMFLDIRDFTPYAEGRDPEEIIQYQNELFCFMIDIIHENHGIVNQFLGDGFMATFGAPTSIGNDSDNAFNASRQIIEQLNVKNASGQIPFTKVGIGLHAGPVVTGNVGTNDRKQFSITGNTVILASRIEQLNKKYSTQLLLSGEVYEHLTMKNDSLNNYEDEIVKGRTSPIRIYKYSGNKKVVAGQES